MGGLGKKGMHRTGFSTRFPYGQDGGVIENPSYSERVHRVEIPISEKLTLYPLSRIATPIGQQDVLERTFSKVVDFAS